MQRIGAWVCRAAWLVEEASPAARSVSVACPDVGLPAESIMRYLRACPEASPLVIRSTLGLSRSMTYRSLRQLQVCGMVEVFGRTKSLVYRATGVDPTRN